MKLHHERDWLQIFQSTLAIGFSLFHLYTAATGVILNQKQIHLTVALILGFLITRQKGSQGNAFTRIFSGSLLLAVITVAVGIYLVMNYWELSFRIGKPITSDIVIGTILIGLIVELTRRTTGLALPILAGVFLIYCYFGPYFPNIISHRGIDLPRILTFLPLSGEAIFGPPISASANYLVVFLVLAAVLEESGGGKFFIDLGNAIAGKYRGGPAKTAVVASGFFGSISGSAVANTVGTGSVTIPLMKRLGYRPEFAGAVEAAASTGGQIMPPIMSAAAFIVAEFLGLSYGQVIVAAAIPAILYFVSLFWMVHLEAAKKGLVGIENPPSLLKVLKDRWYLLLPVIILVIQLAVYRVSPMRAGFWAVVATIAASWVGGRRTGMSLRSILKGLENGATSVVPVVAACATSGIVIGAVTLTGLGLVFSRAVIQLAAGMLPLTLIFVMIASLILGMGVPTIACYVILSIIAAPSLIKLGVNPLGAHLFVLYFGVISNITPPVALASYAAAGVANSNMWKTSLIAVRLGMAGFIVPFMFVYSPTLLAIGNPGQIAIAFITGLLGVFALSCALIGWFVERVHIIGRLVMFAAALLLIDQNVMTDTIGISFMGLIYVWQKLWLPYWRVKQNDTP